MFAGLLQHGFFNGNGEEGQTDKTPQSWFRDGYTELSGSAAGETKVDLDIT